MVKKALFLFALLGLSLASSQASVTLEIDAGILRNLSGTATVPAGGLLQLIASPSGSAANLAAPTGNSFVSGDNIVVASFAMNNSVRIGETDNVISFNLANTVSPSLSTAFDAGDPLLLRWYPTLTYANLSTYNGPGVGTTYGQFRSATAVDGGAAWVTPPNATSSTLLVFATTDAGGGSQPITAGYATNVVAAGVPEPSTYALLGSGLLGLIGLGVRRSTERA